MRLDKADAHLLAFGILLHDAQLRGFLMQVKINGKSEDVHASTLLDVLKVKSIDPHMVAVELNSKMVEREQLGTTPIKEGDALEFLFYMGGGR